MEALINLSLEMFSAGLISFGGGWSVVGILKDRLSELGWVDVESFARILALAQITPGPVALNTSTLLGMQQAGILGAVISTISLVTPGILVLLLGRVLLKKKMIKQNELIRALAFASVALLCFTLYRLIASPLVTWWMLPIAIVVAWLSYRSRVHVLVLVIGGISFGIVAQIFSL